METLGKRMYSMWESKKDLDVDFIVGPDKVVIPAHQFVLKATSEFFDRKFSEEWKEAEKQEKATITLPTNTEEGVRVFVKGIYQDEVDPAVNLDVLKELLELSHTYMVKNLFKLCEDAIIKRGITQQNCLSLVEITGLREISEKLWNNSWNCFKTSLPYLLADNGSNPSGSVNWSAETWETVLNLEGPTVGYLVEQTLFTQLLRWRDMDSSARKEVFDHLVPLVRFPLMSPDIIVKVVLPTKLLSDKDVVDLFCHHHNGPNNTRIPSFKCRPRNVVS